jgi:branched-chain amino acid transport system permease protein
MSRAFLSSRTIRQCAGALTLGGLLVLFGQGFADSKTLVLGTTALIYCLCAQGLNIQYGVAGQLSIAQGAIWGLGAYVAALFAQNAGLSIWVAFPTAALACAVFGVLVGLPSLRVLGNYYVIVTFAIASMFVVIMDNLSIVGADQGIFITRRISPVGFVSVGTTRGLYYLAGILCIVGIGVASYVHKSEWAKRLRVAADNIDLARSLGIRVRSERFGSFAVAGAFAGVSGVLYAYSSSYVQPNSYGTAIGIVFVLIVVLGGTGTILGPLVGSVFVVFLPEVLPFSPYADQVIYGLTLIVVILVIPRGVVAMIHFWIGLIRKSGDPDPGDRFRGGTFNWSRSWRKLLRKSFAVSSHKFHVRGATGVSGEASLDYGLKIAREGLSE